MALGITTAMDRQTYSTQGVSPVGDTSRAVVVQAGTTVKQIVVNLEDSAHLVTIVGLATVVTVVTPQLKDATRS